MMRRYFNPFSARVGKMLILPMAILFCFLSASAQEYTPAIVKFESDSDLTELEGKGAKILRHRGDLALVLFPDLVLNAPEGQRRMRTRGGEVRVEPARYAVPAMDEARKHFGAYRIAEGEGLQQPYTGKGVVTGFCDIFFDPMHINFFDSEGRSRVKKVVHYIETSGIRHEMTTTEEYEAWGTDNKTGFHATHVAGIMAGSCMNGYQGAAPDSEIVGTVSLLSDVGLLAGAEDIIEYAKSVGKPAVINMSVSSYTGPHDGTSLFSQYLAMLGEEAVICMAAGNEGNKPVSIPFTFTEENGEVATLVHSGDWTQFDIEGCNDIWSADSRPFQARVCIFDENTGSIVHETEWQDVSEDFNYLLNSKSDPLFQLYFTGYVRLTGELNEENNRRNIQVVYDAHTTEASSKSTGNWARYNFLLEVKGEPGVKVDIFADMQGTRFSRYRSNPAPSGEMSVSDIGSGDNQICVGMYVNRGGATNLDGEVQDWGLKLGYMCVDSSYGTLLDGTVLPHTAAPGAALISSYSSYFVEERPDRRSNFFASLEKEGKTYYWGREGGTSMATPYVAGYIATWLEANPELTIGDVKRIISETNTQASLDPSDPRNGQGWFHPYEGLLKAIEAVSGVEGIVDDSDASTPRILYKNGGLTVLNPRGLDCTLTLADLSGAVVKEILLSDKISEHPLPSLGKGIYIATVRAPRLSPVSLKIMI